MECAPVFGGCFRNVVQIQTSLESGGKIDVFKPDGIKALIESPKSRQQLTNHQECPRGAPLKNAS